MRLSEISIRRPVLATVMSLLLVLVGLVSFKQLSLREYPRIDGRPSFHQQTQRLLCSQAQPPAIVSR